MFVIPDTFAREMIALHGAKGADWLGRLPTILAACERRWGITRGPAFADLSFHYVASAVRSDGTAGLKACWPPASFEQEAEALQLFDGRGMVRLLECDTSNEVMLLERLEPGTLLRTVKDDEEATSIAATVMRQFWRPAPQEHPFPTVLSDWGRGFVRLRQHYEGGCGPFPSAVLEEAEINYAELSVSMAEPMLLHGDLHHDNILAAQRKSWLAIDPKGLIGKPAYKTGAILRNPLPQLLELPQPGRGLARRVDQLAEELGFDRVRVRGWGLAQAVLSAWWSVEDFCDVSDTAIACAELLASIKV